MAVLKDKKVVGAPFGNAGEYVRVTYDFDVDGGAIADYDVLVADGNVLVRLVNADVVTAITSGGAVAIDLGKGAGGTEWYSDKLKAALAIDTQVPGSLTLLELADGEKIVMGVEADTILTGKISFLFEVIARQ